MLAQFPSVQERCREEIEEVCCEESISYEDCQRMEYVEATCKEVLRFFPLAARFGFQYEVRTN